MSADIKIVDELIPAGPGARKGSRVTYSVRLFLNRGDEVTTDRQSIERYGNAVPTRLVDGVTLIEHTVELGKRRAIAGVEKALLGMSPGAYREVLIPPQLAYGSRGLGDVIPANALLRAKVWVHTVRDEA